MSKTDLTTGSETAVPRSNRSGRVPASFTRARRDHWDRVAGRDSEWSGYYHRRLHDVYRFLIPPAQRVLEIGCGTGDLLAALRPSVGVGVDLSTAMIRAARSRHPSLQLLVADGHELPLSVDDDTGFDNIILSDLINDVWDVQTVLEQVRRLCRRDTRIVLNSFSRVWQPPLGLARRAGLATPILEQNWLGFDDLANLLHLTGLEVVRDFEEILWPFDTPIVAPLCNRVLARLWPFNLAALTKVVVARKIAARHTTDLTVSVIVPARNEAGNIPAVLERVPEMGAGTEIVFVEGHSRDDTAAAIARAIAEHPERRCQSLTQPGVGKADAVRLAFAKATGDVLMILDADLTVAPEDLPRFYEALISGRGEYINGVRLVYPMEQKAMRFLNLLGNKFFSAAFSWLLGQPIKDTLCGTKVMRRHRYDQIVAGRTYFGDFDPFGDFDLIFGAAKLNMKSVDMPIRYRERTYGSTNIDRWRHGVLLFQMLGNAARRLKFI